VPEQAERAAAVTTTISAPGRRPPRKSAERHQRHMPGAGEHHPQHALNR
jgi:hypothetical protein